MSRKRPEKKPAPAPRRVPEVRPGPVGGKRDLNRRRRLKALCDAGLALFLERGIEPVTVDEIARAAGTAKGNFYRYVCDKEELVEILLAPLSSAVEAALDRCEREILETTEAPNLEGAYVQLALDLFQAYLAQPEVMRLYLQEARAPAVGARAPLSLFERQVTDRAIALTQLAHARGLLGKIAPEISALAVLGATERLLLAHLRDGAFDDPAATVQTFVRMVMEGISG